MLNGHNKNNLKKHEKRCKQNPARQLHTVRGLKVGDFFGAIGSDAEFQAPEAVRNLGQGSKYSLDGAIHVFNDGSFHPVIGQRTGKAILASLFFYKGNRCCADEDKSLMFFRLRPDLFPKLYSADGKCLIAEIGTEKIDGAPAPWTNSTLRRYSLNFNGTFSMTCLGCNSTIQMNANNCAQGHATCRNCTSNKPETILYPRSFQAYLDTTNRPWKTVPDACTFLAQSRVLVQMTCTVCNETWSRRPSNQVSINCGCPGCEARHRAELCAYELYKFSFHEADMYPRGQARLEGVHKNPFDVASSNIKVIVEVMSLKYHVGDTDAQCRLPNDIEKMIAALNAGHVFIMVHCEDYHRGPERELAWKRCLVAALGKANRNAMPRVIHVRRNACWTAYDCMREAASDFPYEDIFCGDVNAHATERLPGETHTQTTL
jgi:hypothetical protein